MKLLVPILFLVCSTTVCSAQTNTWIAKSSNGFTPRFEAASVSLNGKIYVIGGAVFNASSQQIPVASLEIYDPSTDTWSRPATTGTFTPRARIAATVFDGKIYAIGGEYDTLHQYQALSTVEVFDPVTQSWSTPNIATPCTPRYGACAAVINGLIYVVGGETNNSMNRTVEVFNPANNTWSLLQTFGKTTFASTPPCVFLGGKFYMLCGLISQSEPSNSVDVFDPATARWTNMQTTGSCPTTTGFKLDTLDGKIFAMYAWAGSTSIEVYDPELRLWNMIATNSTGDAADWTSESIGGKLYLFGGSQYPEWIASNAVRALQPKLPSFVRGTATLDPDILDFGTHQFLEVSSLKLSVSISLPPAARLDSIVLKSTNPVFSITQSANQRLPYTLYPGKVIEFTVTYTAPSRWRRDSARLYFITNLGLDSTNAILLRGASMPSQVGSLRLDHDFLDFGTRTYPEDSTLFLTIANPSSYTTRLSTVVPVGASASQFTVSGNSRAATLPFDLSPGASVTFNIKYTAPPREEVDVADLAVFFDDVPDSIRLVHLRGAAKAPLHIAGEHGVWVPRSSVGFTPRHALTSAVVNGKIYTIGGNTEAGIVNNLEVYDPQTDSWTQPATLGDFRAREFASAIAYHDSIFVFGGYAGNREWLNAVDVYDPARHTWATVPTIGNYKPRDGMAAVVYSDKIYLIAGFDGDSVLSLVDVFDPATRSIQHINAAGDFKGRTGVSAVAQGNKIYVIGGVASGLWIDHVAVFDPLTNSWSSLPTVGSFTVRELFGIANMRGNIYTLGGASGSETVNAFEVLDPVNGIWSTPVTTGTFTARYGLTTAAVGENIYCIGGYDGAGSYLGTNEMYTRTATVAPDATSTSSMFIYPNPTSGQFSIDLSSIPDDERLNVSVVICDLLGRIKVSQPLNAHSPVQTFSVTLSPDTYVLRLVGPHLSQSARIVIER